MVVMGIPSVQVGNFMVEGKPSPKIRLFHKERKPLEHPVLHGIISMVKNQQGRKAIPAENLLTGVTPMLPGPRKNLAGIRRNRLGEGGNLLKANMERSDAVAGQYEELGG